MTLFHDYWFLGYLALLLVGIVLGFMKKITVYRDYTDVGLVFLLALIPAAILIVCNVLLKLQDGSMTVLYYLIGFIEIIVLSSIVYKTYNDNHNVLKTILSLVVKIPVSIFFVIFMISFVAPGGKNYSNRNSNKGIALIFVMMFGIIINGLVASKKWSSRRIGRFGYL
ncbi:MAG: hypothetical protein CVU50_05130 [Candidatus Cloacimonetes bacterium HGW-Cloacimonetes-3]|nr:MAG: hypothetical protein CVU50_05130 [Candidatus Cloacimonetes bacterium HGW-Cloacimonetes-3]